MSDPPNSINNPSKTLSSTNNFSSLQNNVQRTKKVEKNKQDLECREVSNKALSSNHLPPPSFTGSLKKKGDKLQFKYFLNMLKQLHINISLVEALEQIPLYVKFLKDIQAKKQRLNEYEMVA